MTKDEAVSAVSGRLIEAYGFTEGRRIAEVSAESIVRDFLKMLRGAADGTEASEEYRMEDGKAVLVLTGARREDGRREIRKVELQQGE